MFRIKYVGWCHVCKYYGPEGGFICGLCNVKGTCDRPSEYVERCDDDQQKTADIWRPKAATGGTLTVGNVGGFYGYSDGTEGVHTGL